MTEYRAISAFVGIALLGCCGLAQSHAAEIRASNDRLCAFKLEGEITFGDHDRLANVIDHSRLDPLDERTVTLCLRSPGGAYTEALKISELIYMRGISTIVVSGSECFSACALIFMSGVLRKYDLPGGPRSSLHTMPYRKLSA